MGSVKIGVVLGVGAGLSFGIAFTLTSQTSDAAGLSPVLIQRLSGLAFLIVLQRFDKAPILALRMPARKWAIGSGLAGGVALGSLKLGYINGAAGPVSVAASQFAAVAVLLSVIFNKERLRTWQAIGVAASGVGVALMALASAVRPSGTVAHDRLAYLEGVYVPVVTPFDANEGLDLSTLTKVIDFCLDGGVAGVVSCGTTGEYYAMSSDERNERHGPHRARWSAAALSWWPAATPARPARRSALRESAAANGVRRNHARRSADVAAEPARAGGALSSCRRRRRQAGRPLQLSGAGRRRDRLRVPRRGGRSSQHHRHQGVQRRLLQVLASATNAMPATCRSCAAATTRRPTTSRGVCAAGWPVRPTCCRTTTS